MKKEPFLYTISFVIDAGFGVDIDRLPDQLFYLLTVELLFFSNDKSWHEQCLLVMADDQDGFCIILRTGDGVGEHKNQQQNDPRQPSQTPGAE